MSYADQQSRLTPAKLVWLIVAVAFVSLALVGMAMGLTISKVIQEVERVTTVDVEEEPEPEPPEPEEEPPPPEEIVEPPPTVPPPPLPDLNRNNNVEREPDPDPSPRPTPDPTPRPTATATPTPQPPSQARGASTRNEGRWARRIQENYPSRALREEVQGTVGVRVTVTAEGRATNCQVTASSGSSVLDDAACRGMERYARFNPALDRAGNETSGTYSTRITYRLN